MEENTPESKIYSSGYAASIPGRNKEENEDFVIFYEKEPEDVVGASNLYVLVDGLSGTWHAEIAARFAGKKILYDYFKSHDFVDANKLALAIRNASNEIFTYAQAQGETMRAVVLAASITEGKAVIGSIGDSRAFFVRAGKVYQITEDQNILEEKVRSGELTREEAFAAESNVPLVRTIGDEKDMVIDIYDGIDVHPGDVLLLCSDGLVSYIGKKEILEAAQADTPKEIVETLLNLADRKDNVADLSAIAIRIYDADAIQSVVRQPGTLPEDTDLNKETKELNLIKRSKPRRAHRADDASSTKKRPGWLLFALLGLALLFGVFWFGSKAFHLDSLFGPKETSTPTVDPVQATLASIHLTQQAEELIRQSWTATSSPVPVNTATLAPTAIDVDAIATLSVTPTPVETATPLPTPTPAAVVKPAIVSDKDHAEMVYVKGGTFLLGSDPQKDWLSIYDEEGPQLTVNLDPYWIDKTEVTNAQYALCVKDGACTALNWGADDEPAVSMTAADAEKYCKWAGKQLPTEIQWEKAARGEDGRIYPWGDEEPNDENALANFPNYKDPETGKFGHFPVGSFPKGASPYGALDMAGNVWEWTSSLYQSDYYQVLENSLEEGQTVLNNPVLEEKGTLHVIRGGSCASTEVNNSLNYLRAAKRGYVNMMSSYYIGFRCILPDRE